ncbi:unnamed protein product [Hymenolepis diminuta]|uniref:Uncharacterized protein n=1 Tax=Hymenolepis diminuta TaxID=6216 RepID=A0A564YK27_HYMDI|nr:unnamed protein product [Hymenolepis diminuta]
MSQGKDKMEVILNSLQFSFRKISHISIQIRVCYRENLRFQCAALNFKPKTNSTRI